MTKKRRENSTSTGIEKEILKNLISLQKINIETSEKFDKLTNQISELLRLFEYAAQNFAANAPVTSDKDREFLDKINKLLEQNKIIAKGLISMEEKIKIKSQIPPQKTGFERAPPRF
jgi:hypothetical protein